MTEGMEPAVAHEAPTVLVMDANDPGAVAESARAAGCDGAPLVVDARGTPPLAALPALLELARLRPPIALRCDRELERLARLCALHRVLAIDEATA